MASIIWSVENSHTHRLFTENDSGAITLFCTDTPVAAVPVVADRCGTGTDRTLIAIESPELGTPIWLRGTRSIICACYCEPSAEPSDPSAVAFFKRLTPFCSALDNGDFFCASLILSDDSWWKPYTKLIRKIVGDQIFDCIGMEWACRFGGQILTPPRCIEDDEICETESVAPSHLKKLAGTLLDGVTESSLVPLLRKRFETQLTQGKSLTVPLVGCKNYPFIHELRSNLESARKRAMVKFLTEGVPLDTIEIQTETLLELFKITLERDYGNEYDENAICGTVIDPITGGMVKIGYLRKGLAEILAPLLDTGLSIVCEFNQISDKETVRWYPLFVTIRMKEKK